MATIPQIPNALIPDESIDKATISENEDGSMELVEEGDDFEDEEEASSGDFDYSTLTGQNLADGFLSERKIKEIADEVLEGFSEDLESNRQYFSDLKDAVDLLGIKLQDGSELGDWACGASHPLIIENAVKLQAMAVNELDLPDGPVKTRIFGNAMNPEVEAIANRKQEYLNWFITKKMDSFFSESSKVWLSTAIFGTCFKGNHWDSAYNTINSTFLRTDQLITHAETKSLDKATRYTCIYPSSDIEVAQKMSSGVFRKISLEGDGYSFDEGKPLSVETPVTEGDLDGLLHDKLKEITGKEYKCDRLLLHSYVLLDANEFLNDSDEEEFEFMEDEFNNDSKEEKKELFDAKYLPFIVTTELISGKVLGIYANWYPEDKDFKPITYYTDYHLIRGFDFYSLGYVHILGNFQKMLTSIMRSLVDAGTFANLQGGFKLKGTKIAGTTTISPGEFVDVESAAQDISKAIMTLPFKEPSAVLTSMYQILEGRGQSFANATEGVVKDSTNYGKVGTTLALLDASSKLTTAIIRDFHRSRRKELEVIERLIKENVTAYPYAIDGVQDLSTQFQQDFNNPLVEVAPISDPNIPNRAERLSLAQQRIQLAQQFPQVHDLRTALYHVYKVMGDENPDRVLPPPNQAKPQDPVSDIITATQGGPISAFPGQAHEAYITVFNSWITMPETQQNPTMIPAINAVTAAARQHAIMSFQEKIQAMTSQQQPNQGQPPQGEAISGAATDPRTLAMLQAQAAQQLAQQALQLAQQQANAEDPTVTLAKVQEMKAQIDSRKVDSKEKVEFARLAIDKQRLDLEKEKLASQLDMEDNKIKAKLIDSDKQREHDKAKTLHSSTKDQASQALDILGKAALEEAKPRKDSK